MRRFLSSWQGLLAGVVSILLYCWSPAAIRLYDPTAGQDDGGFLQAIALATALAFFGVFVAWTTWQLAFPSMDKWADKHLSACFSELPGWLKMAVIQVSFALMVVYWLACLVISITLHPSASQ